MCRKVFFYDVRNIRRFAKPHWSLRHMIEFLRRIFGKSTDDRIPSPQGKTGDQWEEDDFVGRATPLAIDGGAEFVKFCVQQGTCELDGKVLEKFKEIIRKYPIPEEEDDDEDYDATEHFAVVVRQGSLTLA